MFLSSELDFAYHMKQSL